MSSRPRVVAATDDATTAEFEVDDHGTQSSSEAGAGGEEEAAADVAAEDVASVAAAMGWTPEEASQLICAIFNLGILFYGPDWAAHPSETSGWDISAAQLLDQFLPKGAGGFVQLGAGLFMVGNGIAMMGVRRIPIIQRGPRPLWVPKPKAEPVPGAPPPEAPRAPSNGDTYRLPRNLVPGDSSDVGHL